MKYIIKDYNIFITLYFEDAYPEVILYQKQKKLYAK